MKAKKPECHAHYDVLISKSKSIKKPFKVTWYAENGEPLVTSQLLTTRKNCEKNIKALLVLCKSDSVFVFDTTLRIPKRYRFFGVGVPTV